MRWILAVKMWLSISSVASWGEFKSAMASLPAVEIQKAIVTEESKFSAAIASSKTSLSKSPKVLQSSATWSNTDHSITNQFPIFHRHLSYDNNLRLQPSMCTLWRYASIRLGDRRYVHVHALSRY